MEWKRQKARATHGPVLCPQLCIVLYDVLLRLRLPERAHFVCYAGDILAIIIARMTQLAELILNRVMSERKRECKNCGQVHCTDSPKLLGSAEPISTAYSGEITK